MEIFESACRERVGHGDDNLGHVILVLLVGVVLSLGQFLIVFSLGFIEIETFGLAVDAFLVGVVVLLLMLMMFFLTLTLALAARVVAMLALVALIISIPVAVSIVGSVA